MYVVLSRGALPLKSLQKIHSNGTGRDRPLGLWQIAGMENTNHQYVPPKPPKSFRMVLDLNRSEKRIDAVLLAALKAQKENINLAILTRTSFKQLFLDGRVLIKGQRARASSAVNKGLTYVDILGFSQTHE